MSADSIDTGSYVDAEARFKLKHALVLSAIGCLLVGVPLVAVFGSFWRDFLEDPGPWRYRYAESLRSPSGEYVARVVSMWNDSQSRANVEVSASPAPPQSEWTTVFDWGLSTLHDLHWSSDHDLVVHGWAPADGLRRRQIDVGAPPVRVTFEPDK